MLNNKVGFIYIIRISLTYRVVLWKQHGIHLGSFGGEGVRSSVKCMVVRWRQSHMLSLACIEERLFRNDL